MTTDEEIIEKSISEAKIGLNKIEEGRINAGPHFWRALVYLDNLQDLRKKRNQLMTIATQFFNEMKFYDLSLFAIQSAIELDELLQNRARALADDMIAYGNINRNMGNIDLAADSYRRVIDICLGNNDLKNAASALTNLAGILADSGRILEAIPLLNQSIEYLEKAPFPNTEIITRLLLINILYVKKIEPAQVIENAEVLFNLYPDKIRKDQKKMVASALESAIERYLLDHPELDPQSWKQQKFHLLNYWKSGY